MCTHGNRQVSFETFKQSRPAQEVGPLLADAAVIARMEELSRAGKPAVTALDKELAGKLTLTQTERQYVGRWIKDVLTPRGWKPLRHRRISGGRVFSSGAVYARAASGEYAEVPAELLPVAERFARARDLLRSFGTDEYGLGDYLRDKWAEADREAER